MCNLASRTLVMSFRKKRHYHSFLGEIRKSELLKSFIDSTSDKTIWFKFESEAYRDAMKDTLKDTVPNYKIKVRNGQEQIVVI